MNDFFFLIRDSIYYQHSVFLSLDVENVLKASI